MDDTSAATFRRASAATASSLPCLAEGSTVRSFHERTEAREET